MKTSAPGMTSASVRLLGLLRVDVLPPVHQLRAALVDHALDVGDRDVLAGGAERDEQVEAGERRRTGPGGDDPDVGQVLAGEFQPVEDGRRHDDRGAVLVVVEDRDVHPGPALLLDLEALRRLDVLQVDAAEGRLEGADHVDELGHVLLVDLDVEHVDAGEFLEQDRLALHHGLGGQRSDIAEAQHGRAVREHRHEVLPDRQVGGLLRIVVDRHAGRRHAGRIGQREVALVAQRLGRLDLELPGLGQAVVDERPGLEVLGHVIGHRPRSRSPLSRGRRGRASHGLAS